MKLPASLQVARILLATIVIASTALTAHAQSHPGGSAEASIGTIRGVATALEGDVLLIAGQQVRLHAIDAPEMGQTCRTRIGRVYDCGAGARAMLERLLADREVECEIRHTSIDGRKSGICRIDGISIAGAMVLRGWAFAAVRLAPDYVHLEAVAQTRRAGFWAGRVEAPWLWRSRRLREGLEP